MRLSGRFSYSPGKLLNEFFMEFILNKVPGFSWSKTALKTNIISGQHQEFWQNFESTNLNFYKFIAIPNFLSVAVSLTCILNEVTWRETPVTMCSRIFQQFFLHVTCLWFTGTLTKTKDFENTFTYW